MNGTMSENNPLQLISPTHHVNMWISNVTGIDPLFLGMGWVLVLIALYILTLKVLVEMAGVFKEEYDKSRGFLAFLWWWPLTLLVVFLKLVNLLHLLITVGAAYSSMRSFRDWWHHPTHSEYKGERGR